MFYHYHKRSLYEVNKKLKIIKGAPALTRPTEWAMNLALIPYTAYPMPNRNCYIQQGAEIVKNVRSCKGISLNTKGMLVYIFDTVDVYVHG